MTTQQYRRAFNVTPRILSEADGTAEFIASDNTLDSYNEVVLVSGWKFDLFQRNSPFVDSHNYYTIADLLGRVEAARVEDGKLIETVRFAKDVEENGLARLAWKMTVGGFLRAVSVGFRAVRAVSQGAAGWHEAVAESGLAPADASKCRRIFLEHQQLELSACVLGANPNAVARAYQEQAIGDEDLAAVGFREDDLHFLTLAGAAADKTDTDPILRALVSREMARITARQRKPSSTSEPSKPDGGPDVMRQAADRTAFLRQLEALIR